MSLPFANKIRKPPLDGIVLSMIVDYGNTNKIYDVPNACIVSFETKRNAREASNSFTIVLKSDYVIQLEADILTSNKKVCITYGWVEENRTLVGSITGSDIKFENMAIALSISGVISAHDADDTMKRTCIWKAGTYLDKIISLICEAHGWHIGYVYRAKPLSDDIPQSDMTDSQFLRTTLSGELVTADNNELSDYCLWFDFDGPTTILNYAPLEYRKEYVGNYVYDLTGSTNSRLISFELENMGEMAFNIGSSIRADAIDEDTGEIITYTDKEQREALAAMSDFKAGRRVVFNNQNVSRVDLSNAKHAKAMMNRYWNDMAKAALKAKAKFMGDLILEVGKSVNIAVILSDGSYHYSTGTYIIEDLTDNIDESGYTSSATLVKTSSGIGNFVEMKE